MLLLGCGNERCIDPLIKTRSSVPQATGLVSSFNNSNLRATIFLPKNVAFQKLLGQIGMTVDQALSSSSAFAPYLGQVKRHLIQKCSRSPLQSSATACTDGRVTE